MVVNVIFLIPAEVGNVGEFYVSYHSQVSVLPLIHFLSGM